MPATFASLLAATPRDYPPVSAAGGKVRSAIEIFAYAADAAGAYSVAAPIPAGARILDVQFNTSVSTGTATLALGIAGTPAKYRAAAALTTPDQWVQANPSAQLGDPLGAAEQLLLTVGTASLPASGRLLIRVLYVENS